MQQQSTETWLPIPGCEGQYSVSDHGRIRSEPVPVVTTGRQRGRVLSPNANRKGYLVFRACLLSGRRLILTVHKAVALAFIGPRSDGMEVNHKDGDKTNNRPGNLEYVTGVENIRHSWANGLHADDDRKGEAGHTAKLTNEDVLTIRALHPASSLSKLARQFGVTVQNIWHIVHRKTWTHI